MGTVWTILLLLLPFLSLVGSAVAATPPPPNTDQPSQPRAMASGAGRLVHELNAPSVWTASSVDKPQRLQPAQCLSPPSWDSWVPWTATLSSPLMSSCGVQATVLGTNRSLLLRAPCLGWCGRGAGDTRSQY